MNQGMPKGMVNPEMLELLTVQEVSEILRVSPACVYSLVETGQLPNIRIGNGRGTIRIDRQDLVAYVDRKRGRAREPRPRRVRPSGFVHLDGNRLLEAWQQSESPD